MATAEASRDAKMEVDAGGELPPVDRSIFVSAMGGAVTSVNVITTDGPAGLFGVTVSAMASVSADPPMVLVCVNQRSPACAAIRGNGVFCVNLLAAHQHSIADVFAGHPKAGQAFDFRCTEWQPTVTESARLPDAAATFDCVLHDSYDVGTHTIFIGRVVDVTTSEHLPLAHSRRAYCYPTALTSEAMPLTGAGQVNPEGKAS
jgi:flavin reductase